MNWVLLKNSLAVSGLATLLACGFGAFAALWAAGLGKLWRRCIVVIAVVSLALPPFLVTNSWLHLLGEAGVWRKWLPLNIFSSGGATWILALQTWPIAFFLVLGAWQRLEPSQLESDPALRGWALLRHLLWPIARPAFLQAAIITFALTLNNFAVPAILQVKVLPVETWVRFSTSFDSWGALRLSWPLVLVPLLLLFWLSGRKVEWPSLEGAVSPRVFRSQLGGAWLIVSAGLTLLICTVSAGMPLAQLFWEGRTWRELPGALAAGQLAIWNSSLFAAGAATLCLVLCLAASFIRKREETTRRAGSAFAAALWLPFLVPGVLLGIVLIAVFNRGGLSVFYRSAGIVILALLVRYFAPGWTAISHALAGTDRGLADVARICGASRWQILRYAEWPQISAQAAAAWYVIFLLCLWDIESIVLIVPPGGETLALRIFNLLHYGHNAQVNALCLTLLILGLLPLAAYGAWHALRGRVALLQPARVFAFVLIAVAGLFFSGCERHMPGSDTPLRSQIFEGVRVIGTRGVGVGQFNKPRSVAVDAQDSLYVADMTGRIQKFSSNGVFLLSWQMPQTDLGRPKGMCRDNAGNIVIIEPHYQRLNHFSPQGTLVAQWGERGTNVGQFIMPRAVAVNSHNEIFVSEYSIVERVQKFRWLGDSPGDSRRPLVRVEQSFGQAGNGPADFNRPEGVCVDSQDNLYVADSCNHRIQIYSRDGKLLRSHGQAGGGSGDLSYPYDICVDKGGRQYVCEFGNSRIQVFDASDRPIEIIGGPGAEPGRFSNPWGVALDSAGNLYVADSQNHRVQKLLRKNQPGQTARSGSVPELSGAI